MVSKARSGLVGMMLGVLCMLGCGSDSASVAQAPPPKPQALSRAWAVRARTPGGRWRAVKTYLAPVDLRRRRDAALALVDADGAIQIAVTKRTGAMRSVRVRPDSYGVRPKLSRDRRTATFTLQRPSDVSFEADGDTDRNVHVFVSPVDREIPRRGDGVIRFGPGIHEIPGDHVLDVPANTTVQIDYGAVVHGVLRVVGSNVVIRGHGIVDPSPYFTSKNGLPAIHIDNVSDVAVRDVTILDSQAAGFDISNSKRVVLARVREVNGVLWSDGINVNASSDVLIEDAFLRTSDDSIAVYATTPWGATGSTRNVTVRNVVLWPDIAHPILVGTHGDAAAGETIEQLLFNNVEILEHDEPNPEYQGALAVNAGDENTVRDVQFQNVHVDQITHGQFVNLRVFLNPDYNKVPGEALRDILLRDITYDRADDLPSQIRGYDATRTVEGVTFENVFRAGVPVLSPQAGNIDVGPYVSDLTFEARQPVTTLNDTSSGIRYTGPWTRVRSPGFHGGDASRSQSNTSGAQIAFDGREARIYGAVSPSGGRVTVQVDGGAPVMVDTYAPVTRRRQLWFDTGLLPRAGHRVTIRTVATADRLSRGRRVTLDRVDITP